MKIIIKLSIIFSLSLILFGCNSWNDSKNVKVYDIRANLIYGTLLKVDLILENMNDYAVKDITVSCQIFGASGTYIGSTRFKTIYEKVPAKSKIRVDGIEMGFVDSQTKSAVCKKESYTNLAPLWDGQIVD
jgi:hypothetical protein|tara:strand:+ start:161 stop:553 length:393 start_codon:yes stop_codon:yes gene_type:complete